MTARCCVTLLLIHQQLVFCVRSKIMRTSQTCVTAHQCPDPLKTQTQPGQLTVDRQPPYCSIRRLWCSMPLVSRRYLRGKSDIKTCDSKGFGFWVMQQRGQQHPADWLHLQLRTPPRAALCTDCCPDRHTETSNRPSGGKSVSGGPHVPHAAAAPLSSPPVSTHTHTAAATPSKPLSLFRCLHVLLAWATCQRTLSLNWMLEKA